MRRTKLRPDEIEKLIDMLGKVQVKTQEEVDELFEMMDILISILDSHRYLWA